MLEGFNKSPIENQEESKEKWPYFSGTATSKDFLAAKKFAEKYIDSGKYEGGLTSTPDNIEKLKVFLESFGHRLMPGSSAEGIISELKKAGAITEEQKVKKEKTVDFIKTEYVKLEGPKEVEVSEEDLVIIEANLLHEELEKVSVFKNPEELDALYEKSLELQANRSESAEYYYEFSDAGLIKGGKEEVDNDLKSLEDVKSKFEEQGNIPLAQKEKIERAKKIATITERALAYGVTEKSWYGENVTVEQVSEFDDVKRGVDDILEIRRPDESSFMGLGIDVTFRGLYSEQFKRKFFNLLQAIHDGRNTKVKYFKNHRNELMREFTIPKMVLYFNVSDVKEMVSVLKEDEAEENSQKDNVLRQIIQSCDILSRFAEESRNNVFRKYVAVKNSFKELSWGNPEIKKIMDEDKETDVSKHLKTLVEEFRLTAASSENKAA